MNPILECICYKKRRTSYSNTIDKEKKKPSSDVSIYYDSPCRYFRKGSVSVFIVLIDCSVSSVDGRMFADSDPQHPQYSTVQSSGPVERFRSASNGWKNRKKANFRGCKTDLSAKSMNGALQKHVKLFLFVFYLSDVGILFLCRSVEEKRNSSNPPFTNVCCFFSVSLTRKKKMIDRHVGVGGIDPSRRR